MRTLRGARGHVDMSDGHRPSVDARDAIETDGSCWATDPALGGTRRDARSAARPLLLRVDLDSVLIAQTGRTGPDLLGEGHARAPIGSQAGSTVGSASKACCSSAGSAERRTAISKTCSPNQLSFMV